MNITQEILDLDSSLVIHNEGEWNNFISDYSAFNDAGVECEVGEFLYSMMRILKPKYVLETGTHVGIGASYLGMGLRDNKKGNLDTIEFLPENHIQAQNRIKRLGLSNFVTCHFGDVANFEIPKSWVGSDASGAGEQPYAGTQPTIKYDFIFLDTEPQTRYAEFLKFYPHLKEGGFIFIHDLHRHMHQIPNEEHGFAWPFGIIPVPLKSLVADGSVSVFHFPTPRGLTGFYKASVEDYKFDYKDEK